MMSKERAGVLVLTVAFWCLVALAFCGCGVPRAREQGEVRENRCQIVEEVYGSKLLVCDVPDVGKCVVLYHFEGPAIHCPATSSPLVPPN